MKNRTQFIDKFNLLTEVEKIANKSTSVLDITVKDHEFIISSTVNEGYFCSITIETTDDFMSVYFDRYSKDGCHDFYISGVKIEFPYFKNMSFEDESMFILSDEYKISKFIKTVPLLILKEFLLKLKELNNV